MSNKPTRGTPLSAEEREAGQRMRANLKGWQGGARYNYTSNFGSSSSNTGTRTSRKAGNIAGKTTAVVKPIWRPRWARKYEQENS
jgi:hypothetical protein